MAAINSVIINSTIVNVINEILFCDIKWTCIRKELNRQIKFIIHGVPFKMIRRAYAHILTVISRNNNTSMLSNDYKLARHTLLRNAGVIVHDQLSHSNCETKVY